MNITLKPETKACMAQKPKTYCNLNLSLKHQPDTAKWRYIDDNPLHFVYQNYEFLIPSAEDLDHLDKNFDKWFPHKEYGNNLCFSGIDSDLYEIIKQKGTIVWEEPCYLYTFEGRKFKTLTSHFTDVNGTQYTLEPLKEKDIPSVFSYYSYPNDGIDYIADIVHHRPTLSARIDDQPVSWVVQRLDGSLGIMYTLASHRRLGLGIALSKVFINHIIDRGNLPYIHIAVENVPSIKLAESLGFKRHSKVVWFEIDRNINGM